MNRIKEALEILKAPHDRTSPIVLRGRICVRTRGSCITTRLDTHCEVLQKVKEHLLQSGTDGKIMRPTGNLNLPTIGRTHGSGTWTTSCISTSTTKQRIRREKNMWTSSITKCWRKQAGTTSMAKTRVLVSEKGIVKFTKIKKRRSKSLYPSQWQEAFAEQNRPFITRVPGMVEYELARTICRTSTPTTIVIFKLVRSRSSSIQETGAGGSTPNRQWWEKTC